MEGREELAEDNISQPEAPSLGEQATPPQSLQRGSNPACSDTQYIIERIIMDKMKELFKGLDSIEKRLADLETSMSKIQQDVQHIKSHQRFNSSDSLTRQIQQPEDCWEDREVYNYVQKMRNYRPNYGRQAGAKHLSLKVGRGNQKRNSISKFNSLKVELKIYRTL